MACCDCNDWPGDPPEPDDDIDDILPVFDKDLTDGN
jgi:hypothetical protein